MDDPAPRRHVHRHAEVCTYDDPKDGLATTAAAERVSSGCRSADAPAEINPDDFRRVTLHALWNARGRPGKRHTDGPDREPGRRPRPAHHEVRRARGAGHRRLLDLGTEFT